MLRQRVGVGGWRSAGIRAGALPTYSLEPEAYSLSSPSSLRRLASSAALCAMLLALGGCGNIEPWVKPYERAAFADPIMSMDPHPVSSSYIHHVHEAREGARGASGSSGGGCGCN